MTPNKASERKVKRKPLDLTTFKSALQIVRTGKDGKGGSYNSIGTLNQAAWIGENSGCLIAEIERLQDTEKQLARALRICLSIIHSQVPCVDSKFDNGIKQARAILTEIEKGAL